MKGVLLKRFIPLVAYSRGGDVGSDEMARRHLVYSRCGGVSLTELHRVAA